MDEVSQLTKYLKTDQLITFPIFFFNLIYIIKKRNATRTRVVFRGWIWDTVSLNLHCIKIQLYCENFYSLGKFWSKISQEIKSSIFNDIFDGSGCFGLLLLSIWEKLFFLFLTNVSLFVIYSWILRASKNSSINLDIPLS